MHFHLYLDKNQVYEAEKEFLVCYRPVCFNLNGYNITGAEGAKYAFAGASTMNFVDTYGGSVVAGTTLTLSDAPKITGLSLAEGITAYGRCHRQRRADHIPGRCCYLRWRIPL